jgi:large subunit ribosomal protein L10
MQRSEKDVVVQDVTEVFEKAKGVFVADYAGLTVEKISVLRQKCRAAKVEFMVVKNTLAKRAADAAGKGGINPYFKGPSAIAYSYDDPSAPARVIREFYKDNQKPKVRGSLFEGEFFGPEKTEAIATLPSKNELIARVLGGFNAPITGFVGGLNGILTKFVRTLDAVRESKSNASA